MDHLWEQTGKEAHDLFVKKKGKAVVANGPIIVGAGPSGLAAAACLKEKGVSSIILEKSDCIASLWKRRTYDRLKLHLPKRFCELPLMSFPEEFPEYPDKQQFIEYLEAYVKRFDLRPRFNECVQSASYNHTLGMWRVTSTRCGDAERDEDEKEKQKGERGATPTTTTTTTTTTEYLSRWLVVATGENAKAIRPEFPGRDMYNGIIIHANSYKSGESFHGKNVLVVGCGNSGMEMCLDLSLHNAKPSMVVRDSVHVLPRSMFGVSTFGIAMCLLKWLPVRFVDRLLLLAAWLFLGNTTRHGIRRPDMGPLELKNRFGKTPVLDVGTWDLIRSGRIQVLPAIECLTQRGAKFVDGQVKDFDAVILATGYTTNVLSWLEGCDELFAEDGYPKKPFPNGWKGEKGLYTVGFTRKGLLGASMDAIRIAEDIAPQWKYQEACAGRNPLSFCCV